MRTEKGDLIDLFLEGKFDIIIHGCNCQQMMGAGIAGQIANRIPEAALADKLFEVANPIDKLSNYSYAIVRRNNTSPGIVINLYTQFLPGRDLNENALLLGFTKLKHKLKTDSIIGIPEIGCGIAGGEWSEIGPKIARIMSNHNVTHIEYEPQHKKTSQ